MNINDPEVQKRLDGKKKATGIYVVNLSRSPVTYWNTGFWRKSPKLYRTPAYLLSSLSSMSQYMRPPLLTEDVFVVDVETGDMVSMAQWLVDNAHRINKPRYSYKYQHWFFDGLYPAAKARVEQEERLAQSDMDTEAEQNLR